MKYNGQDVNRIIRNGQDVDCVYRNGGLIYDKKALAAQKAGAALYLDARHSAEVTKGKNSPLTNPVRDLSSARHIEYFYNELNYDPNTWAEWTLQNSAVAIANNKLEFTCSTTMYASTYIGTACKPSTKYLLLFKLDKKETTTATLEVENELTGVYTPLFNITAGTYVKKVITTQATISSNRLRLAQNTLADNGLKIAVSEIRLIELPAGSRIEADANTLDAGELNKKYPMVPKVTVPRSLLNYTPETYQEWNVGTNISRSSLGLEFTFATGIAAATYISTACKPSTKYGLLLEVVYNTAVTTGLKTDMQVGFMDSEPILVMPGFIGMVKAILTSKATISGNFLSFRRSIDGDDGHKIRLARIRLFELPSGSTIENDFNTKPATTLDSIYQFESGKQVAVSNNDAFMTNFAGTTASGYKEETFVVAGGGEKYTLNNIITGGDFATVSAWLPYKGSIRAENGECIVTSNGSATDAQMFQTNRNVIAGHKYLAVCSIVPLKSLSRVYMTLEDTSVIGVFYNVSQSFTAGAKYTISGIVTGDATALRKVFLYGFVASAAAGDMFKVDNFMLYDLTGDFGAGNEPTELNNLYKLGYFTQKEIQVKRLPVIITDGTDDYMNICDKPDLDNRRQPFAIGMTFRYDVEVAKYLMSRARTTPDNYVQYGLYVSLPLKVSPAMGGNLWGGVNIEVGKFYNIFFILANNEVRIFLNGVLVSTTAHSGVFDGGGNNVRIGGSIAYTSQFSKMSLAAVSIYAGSQVTESNVLAAEAEISKDYIGAGLSV